MTTGWWVVVGLQEVGDQGLVAGNIEAIVVIKSPIPDLAFSKADVLGVAGPLAQQGYH